MVMAKFRLLMSTVVVAKWIPSSVIAVARKGTLRQHVRTNISINRRTISLEYVAFGWLVIAREGMTVLFFMERCRQTQVT
jgi:hypothetical protein